MQRNKFKAWVNRNSVKIFLISILSCLCLVALDIVLQWRAKRMVEFSLIYLFIPAVLAVIGKWVFNKRE